MNSGGRVRLEGIVKRHGALTVLHGIDLDIQPGEFFALLGPSGSGKTTTLRILAGLEPANAGKVWLDDEDVTAREPGQRDVAMVFQSYALYPHMTVGENIAFPLRMVNMPRGDIVNAVREAAAKVRIDHLLERRPGQLSGGQQQRCALARAIVRKPRLFLLDEPLSNLDAKLRLETRVELRKLQRSLGVTTVYVTHDQEEAMTIADRMAVFMEGRIAQVGTPAEVFARPATTAVAAFIGSPPMNLLPARIEAAQLHVAGVQLAAPLGAGPDGNVVLGVRPGALRIAPHGIAARVELVENMGDTAIVDCTIAHSEMNTPIKWRVDRVPGVREGDVIHLTAAQEAFHVFDTSTGQRR
jgi:multiple sugar transport system ATP-binding protein